MIVKYSLRELENHKRWYAFVFVQLIITYLMCIGCVSECLSCFKQYHFFQHYYNRDGWFITLQGGITEPNSKTPITEGKALEGCLKSAEVEACYNLGMKLEMEGNDLEVRSLAYDDDIVTSYAPRLQEGRWLSAGDSQSDIIEAVISPNQWGIGEGDCLDIVHPQRKLQAKIVGVLENGTDIYDFNITDNMVSYRNLFYKVDYRYGEMPVLLLLHDDVQSTIQKYGLDKIMAMSSGPVMVMYDDHITEQDKEYNQSFLRDNSMISEMESLPVMKEKSHQYIFSNMARLFPLPACAFLLTLVSIASVSILSARQQMKRMAIFSLLGLERSRCMRIQRVSCLLLIAAGLLAAIAGLPFLEYWGLLENAPMLLGVVQLVSCLVLSLLYFLVCCILQANIAGKNTALGICQKCGN